MMSKTKVDYESYLVLKVILVKGVMSVAVFFFSLRLKSGCICYQPRVHTSHGDSTVEMYDFTAAGLTI